MADRGPKTIFGAGDSDRKSTGSALPVNDEEDLEDEDMDDDDDLDDDEIGLDDDDLEPLLPLLMTLQLLKM